MAARNITNTIIIFSLFTSLSFQFHGSTAQNWVKAGYWYAPGDYPIPDINSALFTHLLCAFANVSSATYELSIPSTLQRKFSIFTDIVKRKNPSVTTLLSIWNGQAQTAQSILAQGEAAGGGKRRLLLIVLIPVALFVVLCASIMFCYRSRVFARKGNSYQFCGAKFSITYK
uniref:L-type lectin-domain containing receptor kinase IX.2-like isoform X4 n=1 Tax=Rhizophora mucronata TaxID=61149 RepID=A0A2P2MFJ6_RHIMU